VTFLLNGESHESTSAMTVQQLLESHGLSDRRVAVAINAAVVPRSGFAQREIREGDRVEVLHAVGGG
jgi:sulfur carrier protein